MENCFVEKSQTPEEFYEKKKKNFYGMKLRKAKWKYVSTKREPTVNVEWNPALNCVEKYSSRNVISVSDKWFAFAKSVQNTSSPKIAFLRTHIWNWTNLNMTYISTKMLLYLRGHVGTETQSR